MMRFEKKYLIAVASVLLTPSLGAQQPVPFRGETPLAPQGLPVLPAPEKPVRIATAEGDVRQGPDGLLYLLTDYDDGALLRIQPAQ